MAVPVSDVLLGVEMAIQLWIPQVLFVLCVVKRTEVFQAEGCAVSLSGDQAEGVLRELLLPVPVHSQGDVEMRSSSLTRSWSSGGNGGSTEGQREETVQNLSKEGIQTTGSR